MKNQKIKNSRKKSFPKKSLRDSTGQVGFKRGRQNYYSSEVENYNAGFTLLEILVASFIFVLVVMSSFIIFSNTIGTKTRSEVYQKAQENLIVPLDLMSRDIREAEGFNVNPLDDVCNGLRIEKIDKDTQASTYLCYFKRDLPDNKAVIAVKTKGSSSDSSWSQPSDLTSPTSVNIENFQIEAAEPSLSQTLQPYVAITIQLKTTLANRRAVDDLTVNINTIVTTNKINWEE